MARRCLTGYLGQIAYNTAWQLQREIADLRATERIPDVLLLLEHPHTYTLGRRGDPAHILLGAEELRSRGVEVFNVDRGGDVTYHGPGQLVGYPILAVSEDERDVIRYVRLLEEVLIAALEGFGVAAGRQEGFSGVWIGNDKIAAIGVKVGKVTTHGFALNVATDMTYFDHIIPCGLHDKGVTSMEKVLGHSVPMSQVCDVVSAHFGRVFDRDMEVVTQEAIMSRIEAGAPTVVGVG